VKKLGPLLALYFAQGLPFGFQATALPLLLRERGVPLQAIGFASLLAAPWMAKPLWAPLVDRYGSARFGRRKSWIVPMQVGLIGCALAAARAPSEAALAAIILVMNLFAATQDIAVDALAVSWLEPRELGPGNAVQVVGYKLGMLTGGGLLVWQSARIGWDGLFYAMAGLLGLVLALSIGLRERAAGAPGDAAAAAPVDFRILLGRLAAALRRPETAALIAVVVTYKIGETLANAMWKPMLFDRGFATSQIGLWTGTFGMAFSLAGSFGSGFMIRRVALPRALLWTAVLRGLGVGAQFALTLVPSLGAGAVIAVTCIEHLFGGAITTVLFALMMRHTDREIGATHYTLLASLEVWGKLPFAAISGIIAQQLGYRPLFAIATLLCLAFAGLVGLLLPKLRAEPA
jgi:MFS transporter, PAT family, beta-lactamase induction signal transducer AmpG